MKIAKNYILRFAVLMITLLPVLSLSPASAQCTDNTPSCGGPSGNTTPVSSGGNCSDTTTNGKVDSNKVNNCLDQSKIVQDLQTIVNFLSAAVGVVIIIMIIVGGVQYSMAGDNSSGVEAARKRLTNAVIALFAFMFAWAFLQWLIPGGIFS